MCAQGALRLGRWQDLQYKGDWMRRPISSNEIGWLVRLLLLLSDLGNRWLYLQGSEPPAPAAPSFPLVGTSMLCCVVIIAPTLAS